MRTQMPTLNRALLNGSLRLLALASLTGCTTVAAPRPSQADVSIRQATDALVALRSAEPGLAGFTYGDSIAANALRNRSRTDGDLLISRLYDDLSRHLESNAQPQGTNQESVRALLAIPRPVGRRTAAYYDSLLSDTRRRIGADPSYRSRIERSGVASRLIWNNKWNDYQCIIDGVSWPMIACRAILLNGEYASVEFL